MFTHVYWKLLTRHLHVTTARQHAIASLRVFLPFPLSTQCYVEGRRIVSSAPLHNMDLDVWASCRYRCLDVQCRYVRPPVICLHMCTENYYLTECSWQTTTSSGLAGMPILSVLLDLQSLVKWSVPPQLKHRRLSLILLPCGQKGDDASLRFGRVVRVEIS